MARSGEEKEDGGGQDKSMEAGGGRSLSCLVGSREPLALRGVSRLPSVHAPCRLHILARPGS